jgi:type IV fimbrial biogenesis protein FimT
MSPHPTRRAGFTTIELMIVLTIAAVLIAFAAPSFADFLSKRRVDGVMAELVTDLHYARSEAVSRNAPVRITFGPRCYVIHLASASSAECDASTAAPTKTIAPTAAEIKTVQLQAGRPLAIDTGTSPFFIEFDPVRGTVANSAGTGPASVAVRSTTGTAWLLRAVLTAMGRVDTCSPGGAGHVTGYSTDCS